VTREHFLIHRVFLFSLRYRDLTYFSIAHSLASNLLSLVRHSFELFSTNRKTTHTHTHTHYRFVYSQFETCCHLLICFVRLLLLYVGNNNDQTLCIVLTYNQARIIVWSINKINNSFIDTDNDGVRKKNY
jgi:hypothetical protein